MKKILLAVLLSVILACTGSAPAEIKNGDLRIVYTVSGKSDTTLVFVHGWCINKEYWQKQQDVFGKRFKVVSMDLGGHGQSAHNRSSWTVNDFANDVMAVINGLKLDKIILVGHSMGGDIILKVADSIPGKIIGFIGVDNFKDISAGGYTSEQQKQIDTFMLQLKTNFDALATEYARAALFPPDYTDTSAVNRVIKDIENADSMVAYKALESILQFSDEPALLSRLKIPVHLIVSDFGATNEDGLKKYCTAGYAVKTIHGTGHYPMIEKPDEFNKLLEETLNEISNKK